MTEGLEYSWLTCILLHFCTSLHSNDRLEFPIQCNVEPLTDIVSWVSFYLEIYVMRLVSEDNAYRNKSEIR